MKNDDFSFKLLAAIITAGVIIALFSASSGATEKTSDSRVPDQVSLGHVVTQTAHGTPAPTATKS
jgi:hypothetical protein